MSGRIARNRRYRRPSRPARRRRRLGCSPSGSSNSSTVMSRSDSSSDKHGSACQPVACPRDLYRSCLRCAPRDRPGLGAAAIGRRRVIRYPSLVCAEPQGGQRAVSRFCISPCCSSSERESRRLRRGLRNSGRRQASPRRCAAIVRLPAPSSHFKFRPQIGSHALRSQLIAIG